MGFSYNVNVLNQKGSPAIYTDTFANRPSPGYAGRLFVSSNTSEIYEDTGTAWTLIANVSSGAGTLQQVTTNGNTSNVGINITAGGLSTNSLTDTALTSGSVTFAGTGGLISQDNANLFWDDTNNRLGINTNTPGNSLDVHSGGTTSILALNNTAGSQSAISFLNTSTAKWRIGNTATNTFDFYNFALSLTAMSINGATNIVSFTESIKISQTASFQALAGYNSIGGSANGFFFQLGTSTITPTFAFNGLTASRNYIFPDAAGTLALTSNLASYLPLTGGTLTGQLNGTTASFNNTISSTVLNSVVLSSNIATTEYVLCGLANSVGNARYGVENNVGGAIGSGTSANSAVFGNAGNADVDIISNGISRIKLLANGNVGINKSNPGLTLDISGRFRNSTSSNGTTVLDSYNTSSSGYGGYISGGSGSLYSLQIADYLNNIRFTVNGNGVITITNLAGTGSRAVLADASGNLSAPVSDETVKENVQPLQYGLNAIMQLNPISFEYIEDYKNYGEGLQIGNIAQDVEKVIPEAVFTTPSTGLKGINYNQFDGIYIKAIQDLNNIIENQNTLIQSLISRIELLENK